MSAAPDRSLVLRVFATRLFELVFGLRWSLLQSRTRYLPVMLCAVVGVLAFVLSAVSPADDIVQREFVSRQKSTLRVAKLARTPSLKTYRQNITLSLPPLFPSLLPVSLWATTIETLQIMHDWASSTAAGERPPPSSRVISI